MAQLFEIVLGGKSVGRIESRQEKLVEFEIEIAFFGDLYGILNCLRTVGKQALHLVAGF